MRQRILFFFLLIMILMGMSGPATAHLTGTHQLGLVDGLIHMFTEPTHVLLLMPALAVFGYYGIRRIQRWRRKSQ